MTEDYFLHNWINGIQISTRWETDIVTSPATGAEQRRQILERPQRSMRFSAESLMPKAVTARLIATLNRLVTQDNVVPLYPDVSVVGTASSGTTLTCTTDYRRFEVGKQVVIMPNDGGDFGDAQLRTITAVGASSLTLSAALTGTIAKGSLAYPALAVYQQKDAGLNMLSSTLGALVVNVLEDIKLTLAASHAASAVAGFPTYGGLPVFNVQPDWTDTIPLSITKDGDETSLGRDQIFQTSSTKPRYQVSYRIGESRADFWEVLKFFDSRRGRLLPFWVPVPFPAWTPTVFNSGSVDVANTFDPDDVTNSIDTLAIVMRDGTIYLRGITGITTPGDIRLTVDSALPTISLADVLYVGLGLQCRFVEDVLEETWPTDGHCVTTLAMVEVVAEASQSITFDAGRPAVFDAQTGTSPVECVIYNGLHIPINYNPNITVVVPGGCTYDHWQGSGDVATLDGVVVTDPGGACGFGTKLDGSDPEAVEPSLGNPDPTDYLIEVTLEIPNYMLEIWDIAEYDSKPQIL